MSVYGAEAGPAAGKANSDKVKARGTEAQSPEISGGSMTLAGFQRRALSRTTRERAGAGREQQDRRRLPLESGRESLTGL